MIEQNLIGDISLLIKFKFRETISHVQQVNIRYSCRFRTFYKFLITELKSVKIKIYYGRNDHKEDKIKR